MNHGIFWSRIGWILLTIMYILYVINIVEFQDAIMFMIVMLAIMIGWLHE